MKPVLLINPNGSEATTEAMLVIAQRHLPQAIGWTNALGPQMITDPKSLGLAGEQIAVADLPEASAVIVAAFGDPGAEALSARLTCPVVGIGQAAALAAVAKDGPFAVATTTPDLRKPIDTLMRSHSDRYIGAFMTKGDPEALLKDQGALDAALVEACLRAKEAGAAQVIIGGGPLAQAAERISPEVSVPLIQPLPEACKLLAASL